jgi:hypothetical protein
VAAADTVDKLGGDPHPIASLADAPLQHMTDAKLLGQLSDRQGFVLEREGGVAGDSAREAGVIGEAIRALGYGAGVRK